MSSPSESRTGIDDDGDRLSQSVPSVSKLYNDAAEYQELFSRSLSDDDSLQDVAGSPIVVADQLTAEPDSYADEADKSDVHPYAPDIHRAATKAEGDSWSLDPDQIIRLLTQEFGPLAADGDQERLLLETDGGMIYDVLIVGVIHLTTHRLAFHASLLATQQTQQRIKAGTAIIHRPGFRMKRRVWLELTHDMLCGYSSSSDEGRIRPLCTILLPYIKSILPFDPHHPRYVILEFDSAAQCVSDIAEFDTEESAQEWRKELTGAIFLHRYLQSEAFDKSIPGAETGVRLSCPLDRIIDAQFGTVEGLPAVVSLAVEPNATHDTASTTESQIFTLGPANEIAVWSQLDDHIASAKRRIEKKPPASLAPIFINFGPLSDFEPETSPVLGTPDSLGRKEKAVRRALALDGETEIWITRARAFGAIASSGYFAVCPGIIGFWCKNLTQRDTKYRIAVSSIKAAKPFGLKFCLLYGLVLEMEGQSDVRFSFTSAALRDKAIRRINDVLVAAHTTIPPSSGATTPTLISERISPLTRSATGIFAPLSRSMAAAASVSLPHSVRMRIPKVINLPRETLTSNPPLHFVCLTIGSRGDVQPYIALGLGLKKQGHRVTIVTHEEYREWIMKFGIKHRQAGGDPGALMKLSVEHKMFSPEFFKQGLSKFRPWLDELLKDSWEGCKDADVLLESPSAMAGVHIAEALRIPYFRTFTMPWTKTSEFPHAFLSPPVESPAFNTASYVLFSTVLWTATSKQINRWRRHLLKLRNTDVEHLAESKIVFIYNFSQAVVPKPLDWSDTTTISGYWFLDNPDIDWTPQADLIEWMGQARRDGKPIVYIGFGSITVPHPNVVTARIVKAVLQSDVRAILSKGWSARMSHTSNKDPEVEIPPECYVVDKVPHDWLFPLMDAALHHGGAGTTGASLRAGIPTLIKPWFGDQFFWGSRVQKLGAGLRLSSLRVNELVDALTKATTSRVMKEKAAAVGERIRAEDGVHSAIYTIYMYLPRASQSRMFLDKS